MVSFDKLPLLTFSVLILIIVAESHKKVLVEDNGKELERLLNYVNRPAIKSFQTEFGDILDCIDINKQLAFDHPMLKTHSVQLRPTNTSKWAINNNNSKNGGFVAFGHDGIRCPLGTVIVKRITHEDVIQAHRLKSMGSKYSRYVSSKGNNIDLTGYHFAVGEFKYDNYGGKANLSIWEPEVSPTQISSASMLVATGNYEHFESIRAGWIVYQWLNKNHSRLFTYWTADGFIKTGCFNTLCPGFVQVSTKIPLGYLFNQVSTYGGKQYEIEISIFQQDSKTGDWWLVVFNENVGYWPKSLFTEVGLVHGASLISYGGEVYSPVKEKSPHMGSGHFPIEATFEESMASFNNFVLLVLLTFTLILVIESAEECGAIPSEEEKKELERQPNAMNKPAIKTFDHHLLKNHSVQLKPKNVPEGIISNNISWKADPLQYLQEGINCPDGTVIVKSTTMQDLMHAQRLKSIGFSGPRNFLTERNNTDVTGPHYAATVNFGPSNFYGVKGHLNLWERLSSISVGWMVNPSLYQISNDHVHLYTYWSVSFKDNPKFGFSIYNGTQYEIRLSLYQDLASGDWWFAYNDENVGYWPASLFLDSGFDKRANYAAWGGQVYSPVTEKAPVMGSGHWPGEGLSKAAYVNSIKVMTGFKKVIDPEINHLKARETSSKFYRTLYVGGLQMRFKEGNWTDRNPCEELLLVNTGALMQAWSNGRVRLSQQSCIKKAGEQGLSGYLKFRQSNEVGKSEKIGYTVRDFAGLNAASTR
uniref:Neprosin PEP catalytic domain-containing protein n=1 Tax=Brassica campestris TaxID=3711 RepID=A0A3P5ZSA7_BRACM|nr:unnamed protein product [Brassica rapa]